MGTITDRLSVSNTVFDENFAINIKARSQFQNQTRYWINILPDFAPTACLVTVWYTPVGGTSIAALDANGSSITINLAAPKPIYLDGDISIITLVHSGLTVGSMTKYTATVAVDTGGTGQSSGSPFNSKNPMQVLSSVDYRTSQSAATLAGKNYKAWVTCAATSAKYSAVQIWNPVGSGMTLFVIGASALNSTGTMKWYPLTNPTQLSTNNGFTKNLKSDGEAAAFLMSSEALTARTANDSVGMTVTATTVQGLAIMMVGELYAISEGSGLRFEGDTVNVGMTLVATVIQIPTSAL
jgi:hypothetical protein